MRSQDGGKGRALRNDRDASFSARAASTPIAVSIRSGAVYGNGSDSMSVDGTLLRISLDRRRSIASVAIAFVTLAIGAPAASSGGTSRPPPWASKGFLVYKCGDSLCLSRPDGGARRELLRTPRPPYPQWDPAFSPHGDKVAFRGYYALGDGDYALYVAGAGGCPVKRLTRSIADDPSWSPDGKWIVFGTSGFGTISKVHPDGTGLTRVIGSTGAHYDASPAWSPTSDEIAFVHYCPRTRADLARAPRRTRSEACTRRPPRVGRTAHLVPRRDAHRLRQPSQARNNYPCHRCEWKPRAHSHERARKRLESGVATARRRHRLSRANGRHRPCRRHAAERR
jgi:WD40 repeat protein